jgi:Zn-dependent peptidase ImmA (M78 family)
MRNDNGLHHSEAFLRKRINVDKKTPEEVAKECNVSLQVIYTQLKKFGIRR